MPSGEASCVRARPVQHTKDSTLEFRTRFHRKTYNGVLELGRVGLCLRPAGEI